jgi:hypothetical protein
MADTEGWVCGECERDTPMETRRETREGFGRLGLTSQWCPGSGGPSVIHLRPTTAAIARRVPHGARAPEALCLAAAQEAPARRHARVETHLALTGGKKWGASASRACRRSRRRYVTPSLRSPASASARCRCATTICAGRSAGVRDACVIPSPQAEEGQQGFSRYREVSRHRSCCNNFCLWPGRLGAVHRQRRRRAATPLYRHTGPEPGAPAVLSGGGSAGLAGRLPPPVG